MFAGIIQCLWDNGFVLEFYLFANRKLYHLNQLLCYLQMILMIGTSSHYYLSLFLSKWSVLVNLLICISLFSFHLLVSFSPKKFQITFSSRCWREDLWRLWGPRCHVCKADLFRWARVYCEARACVNLWHNQGYAEWTWWVWNKCCNYETAFVYCGFLPSLKLFMIFE